MDFPVNNTSAPLKDFGAGRHIKSTSSLCPDCLEQVSAGVYERQGQVWMDKECTEHGRFTALLSSDARHYYEGGPFGGSSGSCCGSACGAAEPLATSEDGSRPWLNHSCTVLIEIIERCNLSCPTCFAGSSPQHSSAMSMNEFRRHVDGLVAGGKRSSDMIQLSGGEPTIHPQICEMVEHLFERGFHKVCINSNGIKLAQPAFTGRLAEVMKQHPKGRIWVYLQFDGFDDETHQELRGRGDLLPLKRRALELCEEAGMRVHPVMTLTRGINDHEVGDFVSLAAENAGLKNVVIQPAMYSGRYDNPRRSDRITLADTVDLICEQFGVFEPRDFGPIPCSDPNCFGMAVALRTKSGLVPLSRYFPRPDTWQDSDVGELINRFSDTINGPAAVSEVVRWITAEGRMDSLLQDLDDSEVDRLLDVVIDAGASGENLWDQLLTISIKPFMDAWTYDQDRVDACCVHILDPDGQPVSFCEYNAVTRPRLEAGKGRPGDTIPLAVTAS